MEGCPLAFFDETSLNYPVFEFIKAHYRRTHELLDELGLYPGQPIILFLLWKKDGRSQTELAEKMRISPPTMTTMLKRMEKAGFVRRCADKEDLRVSRVYLTDKGIEMQNRALEVYNKVDEECFQGFTSEEKLLLRRFFLHMRDNLLQCCNGQGEGKVRRQNKVEDNL